MGSYRVGILLSLPTFVLFFFFNFFFEAGDFFNDIGLGMKPQWILLLGTCVIAVVVAFPIDSNEKEDKYAAFIKGAEEAKALEDAAKAAGNREQVVDAINQADEIDDEVVASPIRHGDSHAKGRSDRRMDQQQQQQQQQQDA